MATIRRDGLRPEQVAVIPGAAGGPKALGIIGLDHALFGQWLPRAPRIRDLIGASIGSWRFAAVCRGDVMAALKDFGDIYCGQQYPPNPSARMVSESARTNTRQLLEGREGNVLSHPYYRLHVLATRGRGSLAGQSRLRTPLGFAAAGLINAFGRRHLRHMTERMWFHDARGMPAFLRDADFATPDTPYCFDHFCTRTAPLNMGNLHPALWASAAIPTVMQGVEHIPGAPPGPIGTAVSSITICICRTTAPMALRSIHISPITSCRVGSTSRCRGGARAGGGWKICCWCRPRRRISLRCHIRNCRIGVISNASKMITRRVTATGVIR